MGRKTAIILEGEAELPYLMTNVRLRHSQEEIIRGMYNSWQSQEWQIYNESIDEENYANRYLSQLEISGKRKLTQDEKDMVKEAIASLQWMNAERLLPRIGFLCIERLEVTLMCMETAMLGEIRERLNYGS